MVRTCLPDSMTTVTHILAIPPCCPVSGNPQAGSTISIKYSPTTGIVLPVEDLDAMIAEYVGGLGSVRAMETMIQDLAVRCASMATVKVSVRADLNIKPGLSMAGQKMIVEVEA